jgi:hypothetical protein
MGATWTLFSNRNMSVRKPVGVQNPRQEGVFQANVWKRSPILDFHNLALTDFPRVFQRKIDHQFICDTFQDIAQLVL